MIVFIGDVHGFWQQFNSVLAEIPSHVPVIQVGDLGAWPKETPTFVRPFHFIEGNHDYIPGLVSGVAQPARAATVLTDTSTGTLRYHTEIPPAVPLLDTHGQWRGATYHPRGTVSEVDGRRIAWLGGAESIIDRAYRTQYIDWWEEEAVRLSDVTPLLDYTGPPVDILVTHIPPNSMVRTRWGYASTYTQQAVEAVWEQLGHPTLVCGHMHPDTLAPWPFAQATKGPVYCLPILGAVAL